MVDSPEDHRPLIELRPMVQLNSKLHYPDIKGILRYLSIEKRRELARKAPALRTLNKKLPYNFKKVELSLIHVKKTRWEVKCDNLLWRFEFFKDDEAITIKVTNPEGKTVDLIQNGPVNRLCQYFLDRPGSFIHTLNILNYNAAKFSNVHPVRVNLMKAKYTKNHYKRGLFKEFKNTSFKAVEIENYTSRNNLMFEDLKAIKTDDLRIWTNAAGENSILELKAQKKFDCYEDASLDDDRFQKFCKKLREESQLGSAYSCILFSNNFDSAAFLEEVKNEFGGEKRYLNGRTCITTTTSSPSHEMNITCVNKVFLGELRRNKLVARIMQKGSSKDLAETPRVNRVRFSARIMLIRFLSFLLVTAKNHYVRHNSIVHSRFIVIPAVIHITPPIVVGTLDVAVLVVATWFTWGFSMRIFSRCISHITRLSFRIPNEKVARFVWFLAVVPLFTIVFLFWGLLMVIILAAYYSLYLLINTYFLS